MSLKYEPWTGVETRRRDARVPPARAAGATPTLHPTPYLHLSTPYTLPTPYTLHPTPYTLNPKP